MACAVGLEVLTVIDDERLMDNARAVGAEVMTLLRGVAERVRVYVYEYIYILVFMCVCVYVCIRRRRSHDAAT